LKRGLAAWRPSFTAPSWAVRYRGRILNAFKEISTQKATGLGAVAGGISEAL